MSLHRGKSNKTMRHTSTIVKIILTFTLRTRDILPILKDTYIYIFYSSPVRTAIDVKTNGKNVTVNIATIPFHARTMANVNVWTDMKANVAKSAAPIQFANTQKLPNATGAVTILNAAFAVESVR